MDITSDEAAVVLKIKGGSLRMIESGHRPASLALAFRAARLYQVDVNVLLGSNEGVPDEPPTQPTGPRKPAKRKDTETKRTGPKRPKQRSAA